MHDRLVACIASEPLAWYNMLEQTSLTRGTRSARTEAAKALTMTTLDVRLLGDFSIAHDGASITAVKSQRLQCLLAYLLLHRDVPIARQRLAFLFWPDSSEAQARSNLRNLLHALVQALPDGERFVETDNQTVQWRADAPFTLDVDSLLTTLANARTEEDLQHALDLYQGPLLPACYDDWIAPERERLEQNLANVLQRFIDDWEKQGKYREALNYAQKLARRDPLREDIYRQIMRLYAQRGDRAGVVRTFKECVEVLSRELDVEPSQQTKEAYDKYLRMEPASVAPRAAAPADPVPLDPPEPAPPALQPQRGTAVVPRVTEQAVTEQQIRRAVLADALQHWTTEVPLAVGAIGAIYLLVLQPVLPLGNVGFFMISIISAVCFITGAGSFAWRYVFGYDRSYADKLHALTREREQAELEQKRARLIEGFTQFRLAEGHYVLRDLDYEFQELQMLIARHKQTDLLTLSYLPALVDETFHQGLNVLDDALELARATSSDHDKRLEAEIKELESKIREIKNKGEEGRIKLLQEKIKSNCQRLEMISRERLSLDGLLQQARKCEAALHDTRVQVASLKAETGTVSMNAVLETLQKTIDQARAVQEEMRKLGY